MYYYVLKLVLKDHSDVEIRTNSTIGTKTIYELIDESYTELEDVDGVLYFSKECISEDSNLNDYSLDVLLK